MKKILYYIIFCIAVCTTGVSQTFEEKIISLELRELIRDYPDSTRVVIVSLEADEQIKELKLKSETRSPYFDVPYNDRSAMALNSKSLQNNYEELLDKLFIEFKNKLFTKNQSRCTILLFPA